MNKPEGRFLPIDGGQLTPELKQRAETAEMPCVRCGKLTKIKPNKTCAQAGLVMFDFKSNKHISACKRCVTRHNAEAVALLINHSQRGMRARESRAQAMRDAAQWN